ncbi:hypothetical protein ACFH04_03085 [Streptomyces noboritoensis]|uniref:Integral membrane protein n=1 Tax=Streptomyces noboritoensis TaxID=67337 RepID=A0ABV6TBB9_9ACTN
MTVGLARRACRGLPEPVRADTLAEWTAELYAILGDRSVHPAVRRWRALIYAADLWRGTWRQLPVWARARAALALPVGALKPAATGIAVGVPLRALMGANYGGPVHIGLAFEGDPGGGPAMEPGHSLLGGGAFAGWVAFAIGFAVGYLACRWGGGRTRRTSTRWSGFLDRHVAGPLLIATAGACCDLACAAVTFAIGLSTENGAGPPSGVVLLMTSGTGALVMAWWRRNRREDSPTTPLGIGHTTTAVRHDTGARG